MIIVAFFKAEDPLIIVALGPKSLMIGYLDPLGYSKPVRQEAAAPSPAFGAPVGERSLPPWPST